eukprot:gene7367-biopygen9155
MVGQPLLNLSVSWSHLSSSDHVAQGKKLLALMIFEYWLHPQRYRTLLCKDGSRCHRRVCFFAHSLAELRVPTNDLPALTGSSAVDTITAAAGGVSSPFPARSYSDASSCLSVGPGGGLWPAGSSNNSYTALADGFAYIAGSSSSCTSTPYQLVNVISPGSTTDFPPAAQPNNPSSSSCGPLPTVNVNSGMLPQLMPAMHGGYGNSLPAGNTTYTLQQQQQQQQQQQLLLEESMGRLGSLTVASSLGDVPLTPSDPLPQPLDGTGSFVSAMPMQQQQQQFQQQQQQQGAQVVWLQQLPPPQPQLPQQQWLQQTSLPAAGTAAGAAVSAGACQEQPMPYVHLPLPPAAAAAAPASTAAALIPPSARGFIQPSGPLLLAPSQLILLPDGTLVVPDSQAVGLSVCQECVRLVKAVRRPAAAAAGAFDQLMVLLHCWDDLAAWPPPQQQQQQQPLPNTIHVFLARSLAFATLGSLAAVSCSLPVPVLQPSRNHNEAVCTNLTAVVRRMLLLLLLLLAAGCQQQQLVLQAATGAEWPMAGCHAVLLTVLQWCQGSSAAVELATVKDN